MKKSSRSSSSRSSSRRQRRANSFFSGRLPPGPRSNSYVLTNRGGFGTHAVFPERYITTLTSTLNLYWAPGRLTAAAGNYFSLPINNIVTPFNGPTYNIISAPGPTYACNAQLVNGGSVTQASMGYSSLAALYTNYRVLSYKLTLVGMPTAASDMFQLVAVPIGFEEIPSASAANVNVRVLASQPRAKSIVCEPGVPAASNTVVLTGDLWNLVGQRKEMWLDQPPTALGAGPSSTAFLGVFIQELNGANNVGTCTLMVMVETLVEFTDLLNPIN